MPPLVRPFCANQANNGNPCSDYSRGPTRMCVHTRTVAMAFFCVELAEKRDENAHTPVCEPVCEPECEPSEGELNGAGEIDEARDGVDDGFEVPADGTPPAESENNPTFGRKMAQLLKLLSIYQFPVRLPHIPPDAFGCDKYHVHDRSCWRCGCEMTQGLDSDATLVTKVRVRPVESEAFIAQEM